MTADNVHGADGTDGAEGADGTEGADGAEHTRDTDGPRRSARPGGRGFHALIALLCALFGFAIVVQVRRTDSGDALSTARPQDLVAILDGLNRRSDDLTAEIAQLQRTLASLQTGGATSQAALEEARRQAVTLGMLAGTVVAIGPGVSLTITDPATGIPAEVLLAALQELRNAGAEAVQVGTVRIGVDSWFGGQPGALIADGTALVAPYRIIAIGDAPTLAAALNIPGGVSDTVERAGGVLSVEQSDRLRVDALRVPRTNTYARPAGR